MPKNGLFFVVNLQKSPSAGGSATKPPCLRRLETSPQIPFRFND